MGKINTSLYAFNRGLVSPLALARTDIQRLALSADTMNNWMPRRLGSMMLRPGQSYIGATASNNQAKFLRFVFSTDDVALIEITNTLVRVWESDALVTRASVSSSITNGDFTTDLTSWTDQDEATTALSVWATGSYMQLKGNGVSAAKREQEITVSGGDANTEHSLSIVINLGPIGIKVGSTTDDDDYIETQNLDEGSHSLAFTPTGNFFITIFSRLKRRVQVSSVAVESSGTMAIVAPWAAADLKKIRYDQSGDIIFIACQGYHPYKIERRDNSSWSVVKYLADDGPFRHENLGLVTISPTSGTDIATLSSSDALFTSGNIGGLFKVKSDGQAFENLNIDSDNIFLDVVFINRSGASRVVTITLAGTWTATVTLQRSYGSADGPWGDVKTYTVNGTDPYNDGFDAEEIYYRVGVKPGGYTSGTIILAIQSVFGSITGILKLITFTSKTSVKGQTLITMGGGAAVTRWSEGAWSERRGYPSSVQFTEGRLAWAGKNQVWLSASDDFYKFDEEGEGDAEAIERTIGIGPVDTIEWLSSVERLLMGGEGAEFLCRSSRDEEPLTPTNFNIKDFSHQGSSQVAAVKVDNSVVFIQRGGTRVMEIMWDGTRYIVNDLTILYPEAGTTSQITHIAIQRQPDTRIHCVRSDGTVAILIKDPVENLMTWITYSTDGIVEDIVILPGADGVGEDAVYYIIKRTIDSVTVRYLEKWALESQCQGAAVSRNLDSHLIISQASSTTVSGLTHLEGETVYVWASGKDLGSYTVSSGSITVSEAITDGCVGLTYSAQWESTKLAYAANLGTALLQMKKVNHLGVILSNTHYQGLKYGPSFSDLDALPLSENYEDVADDTVHATYDEEAFEFPGEWDTDSRLCLQADAPKPCTILAAVIGLETIDKY